MKVVNGMSDKLTKKEAEEAAVPTTKKCPFCKSEIAIDATRCPNCTSELEIEA
jgi:large conductance mechanosensitive channel